MTRDKLSDKKTLLNNNLKICNITNILQTPSFVALVQNGVAKS